MPLNTRDGVADAPIEPGARLLCEPWDFGPDVKLWRLIVPWKPLPLAMPATLTFWPTAKASTVTVSPTVELAGLVAELHERARRAAASTFLRWPSSRLGERLLAHGAEAELDGVVAVDLVGADRGHGARAGLEHGDALDAAVVEEALGHAELLGEDGGHVS